MLQCGYSNPTQDEIIHDLRLTISEVLILLLAYLPLSTSLLVHFEYNLSCKLIVEHLVCVFMDSTPCLDP